MGVLLTAMTGGLVIHFLFPAEPSYDGKRLSDWIWEMSVTKPDGKAEKARAIVKQLAPHSIPLLLRWFREEDKPSLTQRYDEVRRTVLFWLMRHKVIENRGVTSLQDHHHSHRMLAIWAFEALDPASRRIVIPELIQMLHYGMHASSEPSYLALSALYTLPKMAPESVDPLTNLLTNQDDMTRMLAAAGLSVIGPQAKNAIPLLEWQLKDKNRRIRITAANALGKVGGNPDVFIPIVIEALRPVKTDDLSFEFEILVRNKEHARSAVPVLLDILKMTPASGDPTNMMIRQEVVDALSQIAPEAVPKVAGDALKRD